MNKSTAPSWRYTQVTYTFIFLDDISPRCLQRNCLALSRLTSTRSCRCPTQTRTRTRTRQTTQRPPHAPLNMDNARNHPVYPEVPLCRPALSLGHKALLYVPQGQIYRAIKQFLHMATNGLHRALFSKFGGAVASSRMDPWDDNGGGGPHHLSSLSRRWPLANI